jgi:hypothetical protein
MLQQFVFIALRYFGISLLIFPFLAYLMYSRIDETYHIEKFLSDSFLIGLLVVLFVYVYYRVKSWIAEKKYHEELKAIEIEKGRAEIESIRQNAALPHHWRPGVTGVTPTPTPTQKPGDDDYGYKIYRSDGSLSSITGKGMWERAAAINLHNAGWTISDIAKEVLGAKGGYQNAKIKEYIDNA